METSDFDKIYKPVVDKISQKLGLAFISPGTPEGNVCFMGNTELRQDFKVTFTQLDVINFVYAVLHSSPFQKDSQDLRKIDLSKINYPEDLETFWKLVRQGALLRQPN